MVLIMIFLFSFLLLLFFFYFIEKKIIDIHDICCYTVNVVIY